MSEYRAILVSREQRDVHAGEARYLRQTHCVRQASAHEDIWAAFDAAGDQPRIQWCAEHGEHVRNIAPSCIWFCDRWSEVTPCRVVDAIVVPLPEQP
jgi:hypothetical protein